MFCSSSFSQQKHESFHILSDPLETTTWSTWSYCKKYWSKRHDRNFRKEPIQSGFTYFVVWAARLIHLQFYQTALFLSCLLLTTFTANSPCLDPLLIVSCSHWGTSDLQSTPDRCLSQYWLPCTICHFIHSFANPLPTLIKFKWRPRCIIVHILICSRRVVVLLPD